MASSITPSTKGHYDYVSTGFFERIIATSSDELTPNKFDANIRDAERYGDKIDLKSFTTYGTTFMYNLAAFENETSFALMRHLHSLDHSLLDLGSDGSMTPLLGAIYLHKMASINTLLELGCNVNIATTQRNGEILTGATALWMAIEKTKSVALIKLLLRHGAAYQLPLSVEGQGRLNQAKAELAEQRANQMREIQAGFSTAMSVQAYPTALVDLIHSYV